MRKRFHVGSFVTLTSDARENECYAPFAGSVLRVTSVSTRHMPASEFFAKGKPDGYHPGFDSSSNCALYDLETKDGRVVTCSLYDWELR